MISYDTIYVGYYCSYTFILNNSVIFCSKIIPPMFIANIFATDYLVYTYWLRNGINSQHKYEL